MRLFIIISVLYLVITGCCLGPNSPLITETFSPDSAEMRLQNHSEEMQKLLNESGLIYRDALLEEYLKQIVLKLQPPQIHERFSFKILIIENPYLEAFALANGTIGVHTGLLARLENEAQLAFLLAHEMTHCTHRHALRTLLHIENKLANERDANGSLGEKRLLTLFGTAGSIEAIRRYTQDLETESDSVGLGLIMKAGYDPIEALGLLEFQGMEVVAEGMKEPLPYENDREIRKRKMYCQDFIRTQNTERTPRITNTKEFFINLQEVILGNSLLDIRAGRFCSAQRNLEKYLAVKSDDARAHYLLGEVFRQRREEGDRERGKEHYQRALSLDPSFPDPHRAIGLIYYKSGNKALSQKHFQSYMALSPRALDIAYIRKYLENCKE